MRSRYPVQNAADKLTDFGESPRAGFQALCALARWLGSRNERLPAAADLADAAAGAAAGSEPSSCWGRWLFANSETPALPRREPMMDGGPVPRQVGFMSEKI